MKKIVKNDRKKRYNFLRKEKNKIVLKSLTHNTNFNKIIRWNAILKISQYLTNSNKLKKRCFLTGRKNILNKYYRSSRLMFFKFARTGLITGVKKSVW